MKYDKNHALLECAIPGLPQKSGKVRDVFDLGDKLLMVVTDRISAFDVILPCGVPDKGKVLNQLSLFWMEFFGMKNHLVTANVDEYPAELKPCKEDLRGRSMLVKKVKMVEVECIARRRPVARCAARRAAHAGRFAESRDQPRRIFCCRRRKRRCRVHCRVRGDFAIIYAL